MKINGKAFWDNNKDILIFIVLMCLVRSSLADINHVPTGSMLPTIIEGDRIAVNKMAYDLRVPFTKIRLAEYAHPERGDIVVFDSNVTQKRMVKRVIGLPGDRISMRNNVLHINQHPLEYSRLDETAFNRLEANQEASMDLTEALPGQTHQIRLHPAKPFKKSFQSIIVPDNQYLVLGDNRDNSADSRFIGFIPRHEIVGRTSYVLFSLNPQHYYQPRAKRFFSAL